MPDGDAVSAPPAGCGRRTYLTLQVGDAQVGDGNKLPAVVASVVQEADLIRLAGQLVELDVPVLQVPGTSSLLLARGRSCTARRRRALSEAQLSV
jgi:hypothetical protein